MATAQELWGFGATQPKTTTATPTAPTSPPTTTTTPTVPQPTTTTTPTVTSGPSPTASPIPTVPKEGVTTTQAMQLPGVAPLTPSSGGLQYAPSTAPTTSGFVDTRADLVTAQPTALQNQANSMLGQALTQYQQTSAPQTFQPVSGPNYSPANQLYGQAQQTAAGASLPGYGQIAPTGTAPTLSLLQQALAQSSSPEAQQLRTLSMQGLEGLSSAPDRAALAAEALRIQREMTQPQWEQDLRAVGQKAAALGRIGAGMTTNELTDVTLAREKALGLYGQQLANDAAGLAMQDRLNVFDRTTGLGGQVAGQDLARASFGQQNALSQFGVENTARDQAFAERGFQSAQDQSQANLAMQQAGLYAGLGSQQASQAQNTSQFGAQQQQAQMQHQGQQAALQQALLASLSGLQGQQFDQSMQTAGLATQQQQWQNQLAQQALGNQVGMLELQEALLNGDFNRQLTAAQAQAQYGSTSNPYAMQLAGSESLQQQAAAQQAGLAELARQLAAQGAF